ncbi:hypothetical protein CVT26_006969 [Gymnopilus dilepis]|uniref:Uncharacterized protein n=1 Tax=Gymnopilus dilepis TaxID=231916 RepID=A0A409W117_9AGAR|nr:hypothetical protein CVT26_006969 [Gymnopilus dilepis]
MVLLTLDDRNPSIIYSTGWNQAGSALEFNKTTTWTAVAGSTAKFTFQGTGVGVFGTVGKKLPKSIAPVSEYSIDGSAPVTFTADPKAVVQTSQAFFQSPLLPDGVHTLTVTNKLASDPLFLDFLMVLADSDTPLPSSISLTSASSTSASSTSATSSSSSATSSSSVSTTSSSSSSSVPTLTVTSTVAPSTTSPAPSTTADSDTTGATKSSNTGAIVGGIIAAVVGVTIIVFAILFWYRRHKRRNEFRDLMDNNPDKCE